MKLEAACSAGTAITAALLLLWSIDEGKAQTEWEPVKLESFVNAAIAMNEVVEQWRPWVDAAMSKVEAAALRDEAEAAIKVAMDRTEGINVSEYRQIYDAAMNDPQLMIRLVRILEARTNE